VPGGIVQGIEIGQCPKRGLQRLTRRFTASVVGFQE